MKKTIKDLITQTILITELCFQYTIIGVIYIAVTPTTISTAQKYCLITITTGYTIKKTWNFIKESTKK